MCAKPHNSSLLLPGDCNLRLLPLGRLLVGLANLSSLHCAEVLGCFLVGGLHRREHSPHNSSFCAQVSICLFFLHSLACPSQVSGILLCHAGVDMGFSPKATSVSTSGADADGFPPGSPGPHWPHLLDNLRQTGLSLSKSY